MMVAVLVGVQGSSVFLYYYSIGPGRLYNQPQIVAPQFREAWETKYLEVLEF